MLFARGSATKQSLNIESINPMREIASSLLALALLLLAMTVFSLETGFCRHRHK
jgi:hypothetical protein